MGEAMKTLEVKLARVRVPGHARTVAGRRVRVPGYWRDEKGKGAALKSLRQGGRQPSLREQARLQRTERLARIVALQARKAA